MGVDLGENKLDIEAEHGVWSWGRKKTVGERVMGVDFGENKMDISVPYGEWSSGIKKMRKNHGKKPWVWDWGIQNRPSQRHG